MAEDTKLSGRPHEWLSTDARERVTRRSTGEALIILAAHYAFYVLTLMGALAPAPLAVNLVFAALNGLAIGLLFVIGHDCVHKAYAPTTRANQILARLAFIPCAHSASQWEVVHNRNHHGKTNLKTVDYVWSPMSMREYENASPARRWLERFYRSAWGPILYYYIEFSLRRLIAPATREMRAQWRRHLPDSLLIITMLMATIAGILTLGAFLNPDRSLWLVFLLGWALPFSVWNYLVAISVYLHHTHPRIHWFDDPEKWSFYRGAIAGATDVKLPFRWSRLYSDVMRHTAHHAMPNIPIYRLSEAQDLLLDRYGDRVVKYDFSVSAYLDIVRACKLYDFERQCWTDFNGVQTGPRLMDETDPVMRAAAE
ncbi:MAG: fatty acid desaturase [Hyphococcus sp.]